MISRDNDRMRTDHRVASNGQSAMAIENAIWPYVCPRTNPDSSAIGRDNHTIGDGHPVGDDDFAAEVPAV